jgi:hypothetical protein
MDLAFITSVPQKLRENNQTTAGNLIYFFAILIPIVILTVLITRGITIRISITVTM